MAAVAVAAEAAAAAAAPLKPKVWNSNTKDFQDRPGGRVLGNPTRPGGWEFQEKILILFIRRYDYQHQTYRC